MAILPKAARTTPDKKAVTATTPVRKKKRIGKVKGKDLTIFCRQFATMIGAGVGLVRCLAVLEQQAASASLKTVIREIQFSVEGGETLTRSLAQFPKVFSSLFVGLVRAGEVGGVLEDTLARLAGFLEEDMKLKRKVKAAMTYPVIVMTAAILIVVGLVTFIVPKFIQLFKEFDLTLPGPTLFLMNVSNFMTNWVNDAILIGTIVVLSVSINRFKATKTGKLYFDKFMLKVPIIGRLNHMVALARFSRTLSTLMASGV
ncbi:MAG TPA: type II secretion system F family protein, partial [Armatimonadota bacterium]